MSMFGPAKCLFAVLACLASACAPDKEQSLFSRLEQAGAWVAQCEVLADSPADAVFTPLPDEGGDELRGKVWRMDEGGVCFDGGLSAGASAWFDAQSDPVNQLIIRSAGGSGPAGIDIAETLLAWNTEIIVWDFCYSACANYVFVAGSTKTVPEPGVVGFHQGGIAFTRHGALFTPATYADQGMRPIAQFALERFNRTGRADIPDAVWFGLPETVRRQLTSFPFWRLRGQRLYNYTGVRHDLLSAHHVIRGRLPMFAADAVATHWPDGDLVWTPDAEELARWGVENVVMWRPDGPEHILELGLASATLTFNIRAPVDQSYFPFDPNPDPPDDSGDWPRYEGPN